MPAVPALCCGIVASAFGWLVTQGTLLAHPEAPAIAKALGVATFFAVLAVTLSMVRQQARGR